MFGDKKNSQSVSDNYVMNTDNATIIGANTQFEGKIKASGVMKVDGAISGGLDCSGYVIVSESGSIRDDINTSKITISGTIEGNINCKGILEMTQSAILNGDIEVGSMSIEEGAIFNGKCTTIKKLAVL